MVGLERCGSMIKKAMFMEGSIPKGGTCLSVFLVLKGKEGILVGKMTKPEIWIERFLVGESFAPRYASSNKCVLPASHLKYGEKPEDAARRVLVEEVGVSNVKLSLLQVQSHLSQDPNDPEAAHWDICFVYGGQLRQAIAATGMVLRTRISKAEGSQERGFHTRPWRHSFRAWHNQAMTFAMRSVSHSISKSCDRSRQLDLHGLAVSGHSLYRCCGRVAGASYCRTP